MQQNCYNNNNNNNIIMISTINSTTSLSTLSINASTTTTTETYIVLPGPEDIISLNYSNGQYQQSVTLTARMWPPIEAGSPKTIWGLPAIWWGILIGSTIIFVLILAALFLCCWLLPRRRKVLSPSRDGGAGIINLHQTNVVNEGGIIMAHHSVAAKSWTESNYIVMPTSMVVPPPQYNAPPHPHHHHYHHHHHHPQQQQQYTTITTGTIRHGPSSANSSACDADSKNSSFQNIPETHKSMWAVNPLYASNSVLNESDSAYRTRSLPAWGKLKQRPVSTTDDLEELYAKVNFSKKRKNRMRNGEAAIIALCRSRSQNLQGNMPSLEREGVVVYDERTAL